MRPPIATIKPTSGGRVPSLCVFIDTESIADKGSKHGTQIETWRLGCAIKVQRKRGQWVGRELHRFDRPGDLWDWVHSLESIRRPVWVFGHNIGFDLTISDFWSHIDSGRWGTSDVWPVSIVDELLPPERRRKWRGTIVVSDPPTILVLRSAKGGVRLVDTFNYFNGPLSTMGKSIGLSQLPAPDRSGSNSEWFTRCERDCEILAHTVCGWLDKWASLQCGSWRPTGASLGYSAWRATIGKKKIAPDQSEKQLIFARSSYYGGQTEVYYCGRVQRDSDRLADRCGTYKHGCNTEITGPVYHLDVHSLYPSVMAANYYPRKFIGFTINNTISYVIGRAKFHLPIARVSIDSINDTYPTRQRGSYMHSTGRFTTYLAGEELLGAINRDDVRCVSDVAWYEPDDLFNEFVRRWVYLRHEAQAKGDSAGEMLCKLVLNSISGKFAQHKTVWRDTPDIAPLHRFAEWQVWSATTRTMSRYRSVGGCTQTYSGVGESRQSFPAISAFITANGRERMRYLRSLCPARSVLYMDTDSLMVTQAGFDALLAAKEIGEGELGKLQVKDVWDWVDIRGFKFYMHPNGIVCPGLKKDSRLEKHGTWRQERFQRLASILSRYAGPKVVVDTLAFTPVGTLGHRKPGLDGWTVPPVLGDVDAPF